MSNVISEVVEKIRIIGQIPKVERRETGLFSFDRSVGFRGQNGIPLRSLIEIYGPEASGKSTFAWFLASKVNLRGGVWIADLEGTMEEKYVREVLTHAGFEGTLRISDYQDKKGKMRNHEEQIGDAVDAMLDDDYHAAIIDSIGAFVSIANFGKEIGERTMGQEAKTISDVSKRLSVWLRLAEEPKLFIYINHVHPNFSGPGFSTPGGVKMKYISNVRLWIRRIEADVPEGTGNFLSEVRVQKLKHGGTHSERKALIYFVPGFGVSREMTAVFECIKLDLAEREATIKLELLDADDKEWKWTSMGRLSTLAEKALDPEKNKAAFAPFFEALEKTEEINK